MAKSLDHAEFSLPSEDDLLCFSSDFDSAFSSPVESVANSTETENSDDDEEEEEEDFLAGLTRRLAQSSLGNALKRVVAGNISHDQNERNYCNMTMAGSPQSTLSGLGSSSASKNGSPNGPSRIPSPQTVPFGCKNDTLDLIHAAASEVARLKMYQQRRALLEAHHRNQKAVQFQPRLQGHYQHVQNRGRAFGFESARCAPQPVAGASWSRPCLQQEQQSDSMRALFVGGSDVKKKSTGTGVFLPRRYGNPVETRKKSSCPTVLIPPKVVQALNLSYDGINKQAHPRFISGPGYPQIHHVGGMMARSNGLLTRQRRSIRNEGPLNQELLLPQEWTY